MAATVGAEILNAMDAEDNGNNNPFDNRLRSLEWIACAMNAARRHKEQELAGQTPDENSQYSPRRGDPA